MNEQQITEAVRSVITTVLKLDPDDERSFSRDNTAEWDSLKHIEIMFAVEEELDVQFSEQELSGMDSLEKIVATVSSRDAS